MLDNEIQFELKKLENKLYSLLKNYNELKNKTEELNQKNEDIYINNVISNISFHPDGVELNSAKNTEAPASEAAAAAE